MDVSITRHRADLRALARKANRSATKDLLEKIQEKKSLIKDNTHYRNEHFATCESCNGG